jgi:hypothetical protein
MGISTVHHHLRLDEEAFLQALLWEESHLQRGPATRAASEHGLSVLRCLEVANRLSPNLQGHALAQIYENPCPNTEWPWPGLMGAEVLQLLWGRLSSKNKSQTFTAASNPLKE